MQPKPQTGRLRSSHRAITFCSPPSIPKMSTLADIVPPGVVTGDNLVKLLDHARSNGYAIRKFLGSSTSLFYRPFFLCRNAPNNECAPLQCCGFEFALVGHERIRYLLPSREYCACIFLSHFTPLIMHHIAPHMIQCSIDLSTRARPHQLQPPSTAPPPRPSTPASRPPRSTTVPS